MDDIELKELIYMLNRARGQIMRVNVNASFFSKIDLDNQIFDIDTILPPEAIFNMAIKIKDREPLLAAHYFRTAAKCDYKLAYIELAQLYKSGKLGQNVQPLHKLFDKRAARLESSGISLHEETFSSSTTAGHEIKSDTEFGLIETMSSTATEHIPMTNLSLATNINCMTDADNNSSAASTSIAGNTSSSKFSTAGPHVSGRGGMFYSLSSFTGVARNMGSLIQQTARPLLHGFHSQQITMGLTQIANSSARNVVNVLQDLVRDTCSPDGTMRMR